MKNSKILVLTAILTLSASVYARWAGAIEVSLEENKAAKGSIGFVDMHVLFKAFPETQKAKLSFEDATHQAEEQINRRRAELIGLRAEIAQLKAEKDFVVKASPHAKSSRPTPVTDNTASTPASVVPPNIPGSNNAFVASNTAATSNAAMTASDGPAASPPSAFGARIESLDRNIDEKTKELDAKEADFKTFEAQAEKSLLDLESRKTEILLGQIYGAIEEAARVEGISVVMDKSQILFGQKAVDLTDKVLKKLKSQLQ